MNKDEAGQCLDIIEKKIAVLTGGPRFKREDIKEVDVFNVYLSEEISGTSTGILSEDGYIKLSSLNERELRIVKYWIWRELNEAKKIKHSSEEGNGSEQS